MILVSNLLTHPRVKLTSHHNNSVLCSYSLKMMFTFEHFGSEWLPYILVLERDMKTKT